MLILFACGEEKILNSLDDEIILSPGESVFVQDGLSGLRIEFVEVIENSLCPPDAVCIWYGRHIVKLKINNETEMILGYGSLFPSEPYVKSDRYQNYQITFLDVIPIKNGEHYVYNIKLEVLKE